MNKPKFKVGDKVKYKKGQQTATVMKINQKGYEISYKLKWDDTNKEFTEGESSLVLSENKMKYKKIVTEMIKSQINESTMLDSNELKVINTYVNGLGATPTLRYSTNDSFILQKAEEINKIRIEIMNYVEENSNYKFIGKSPQG